MFQVYTPLTGLIQLNGLTYWHYAKTKFSKCRYLQDCFFQKLESFSAIFGSLAFFSVHRGKVATLPASQNHWTILDTKCTCTQIYLLINTHKKINLQRDYSDALIAHVRATTGCAYNIIPCVFNSVMASCTYCCIKYTVFS